MKKMISILLLLAIICSLSTPALAGGTVQAANAPLSWAEVEPVKVFGHSEGITLTAAQTELVLANTDGELLHLPIPDGTTPSVSICTIADSFALLLHLEEPYLILFEDMTPDQLTLSGTFDRVTADSSLTTALTLIADEQSTISHMELFSPVTVENAGVIEKLSVVETATISGGDLPQNSLSAENTGNALEAAAQIICEEIARAIELHSESTEQSHVFLIVSGADTAVKAEAAEQPATLPVEKEDAPSVALPCGHMSDADGNHDKLSCGHYACASGDHAAASCGMSNHHNCDGKTHTAAVCGTSGHTNCDEADHSKLPCGHFTCEDGDHTAAICGTSGHFNCDGKTHTAAVCGTSGHFNCDGDHNAAGCNTTGHYNCAGDHAAASCGAVGHYNCDGKTHQTPDCEPPLVK